MTATETKERPILFNGEMVRAILEGRKTQTRRKVKPQLPSEANTAVENTRVPGWWWAGRSSAPVSRGCVRDFTATVNVAYGTNWNCPFGTVGDRLWVRETWKPTGLFAFNKPSETKACGRFAYDADDSQASKDKMVPWRPSIHMPRWASRITLEITGVRVERLQDISEEDAKAEGVFLNSGAYDCVTNERHICEGHSTAKLAFKHLWNCVYENWDASPWVWVVEFRKL